MSGPRHEWDFENERRTRGVTKFGVYLIVAVFAWAVPVAVGFLIGRCTA